MFWIESTVSVLFLSFNENARPRGMLSGGAWKVATLGSFHFRALRFPSDFLIVILVCFGTHWTPKSSPPNGFRTAHNDIWPHLRFCCYLLYFRTILTILRRLKNDMKRVKKLLLTLCGNGCVLLMILAFKLEPKRWGHSVPFPLWALPWQPLHSELQFASQNYILWCLREVTLSDFGSNKGQKCEDMAHIFALRHLNGRHCILQFMFSVKIMVLWSSERLDRAFEPSPHRLFAGNSWSSKLTSRH